MCRVLQHTKPHSGVPELMGSPGGSCKKKLVWSSFRVNTLFFWEKTENGLLKLQILYLPFSPILTWFVYCFQLQYSALFLEHDWTSIGIYNCTLKIVFNRNRLHRASEHNFTSFFPLHQLQRKKKWGTLVFCGFAKCSAPDQWNSAELHQVGIQP